jgi:hypothetical protein
MKSVFPPVNGAQFHEFAILEGCISYCYSESSVILHRRYVSAFAFCTASTLQRSVHWRPRGSRSAHATSSAGRQRETAAQKGELIPAGRIYSALRSSCVTAVVASSRILHRSVEDAGKRRMAGIDDALLPQMTRLEFPLCNGVDSTYRQRSVTVSGVAVAVVR